MIASTAGHAYEGITLPRLAAQIGGEPFDALVCVLRSERLRVSMVRFAMTEEDVETVLAHPQTMIGADGLSPGIGGRPHPRMFGTFPRVLGRYVQERVLSLPEAIARMTGLPFRASGCVAGGESRPVDGRSRGAGARPGRRGWRLPRPDPSALGVAAVIQGGHVVVRHGRWLGVRRGRRLTPS